jgi:hypothetical protein
MDKFKTEKARLESYEERYKQLEEEKMRIEAEENSEANRRHAYEKHMSDLDRAVEYIQAHWRGLKTRAEFEKLKRGRRGRRGGKKGKKK